MDGDSGRRTRYRDSTTSCLNLPHSHNAVESTALRRHSSSLGRILPGVTNFSEGISRENQKSFKRQRLSSGSTPANLAPSSDRLVSSAVSTSSMVGGSNSTYFHSNSANGDVYSAVPQRHSDGNTSDSGGSMYISSRSDTFPTVIDVGGKKRREQGRLRRAPSFRSLKKWVNRLRPPVDETRMGSERLFERNQPGMRSSEYYGRHSRGKQTPSTSQRDYNNSRAPDSSSVGSLSNYESSSLDGAPVLSESSKFRITVPASSTPGLTGIRNRGNTCYLNAVIQCLSATDGLAYYLLTNRYLLDLNPSSAKSRLLGTHGEITRDLADLLKSLWAHVDCAGTSKQMTQAVEYWSQRNDPQGGFKLGQQQDAQEFLVWLLDKVHEDLNAAKKKKAKPLKQKRDVPEEWLVNRQLEQDLQCNRSFIRQLFGGQFRSTVLCPFCNHARLPFEPFTCVSLSVPQSSTKPLFVVMVYFHRRPRLLCLGLNADASATFAEVKQCLAQEAKVDYEQLVMCHIPEYGVFERTFRESQVITSLGAVELIYAIETPPGANLGNSNSVNVPLSQASDSSPGELLTIVSLNSVVTPGYNSRRYGSPICLTVMREVGYLELRNAILTAFRNQLRYDVSVQEIPMDAVKLKIADGLPLDPYLREETPMPLYTESVDSTISCHNDEFGPTHLKIVLEWEPWAKERYLHPVEEEIFDHISACDLREEIESPPAHTLTDCLGHYTQPELVKMDGWRCPNCKSNPPTVEKRILFRTLPDILLLHLKRFKQMNNGEQIKLDALIDFPVNGLDLSHYIYPAQGHGLGPRSKTDGSIRRSPRVTKEQDGPSDMDQLKLSNPIYDLYAVCNHRGESMHSGHYTAFCRNPVDGLWYCFDDEKITRINESSVISKEAYLLFYERRSVKNRASSYRNSAESGFAEHWAFQWHPSVNPLHLSKTTTPRASHETLSSLEADRGADPNNNQFNRGSRSYASTPTRPKHTHPNSVDTPRKNDGFRGSRSSNTRDSSRGSTMRQRIPSHSSLGHLEQTMNGYATDQEVVRKPPARTSSVSALFHQDAADTSPGNVKDCFVSLERLSNGAVNRIVQRALQPADESAQSGTRHPSSVTDNDPVNAPSPPEAVKTSPRLRSGATSVSNSPSNTRDMLGSYGDNEVCNQPVLTPIKLPIANGKTAGSSRQSDSGGRQLRSKSTTTVPQYTKRIKTHSTKETDI